VNREDLLPVVATTFRSISCGDIARGVGCTDDGPHAGAGDVVHRDAVCLEHLEHADVRDAERTASGQHEADAGSARRVVRTSR